MLNLIKLLLPALFPSWRFFDVIAPSPRVEHVLIDDPKDEGENWQESRPTPQYIVPLDCFKAFFWNAGWNETLYMSTCAERLVQNPMELNRREIRRRIRAGLLRKNGDHATPRYFRFRLIFVSRQGGMLRRDIAFVSPAYLCIDPLDQ
ncbi:MAG: hypothetical protein CMM47_11850 [Rhodospirillaceae bacterium]|nr:hypothetical protein [Rhodospirillaceae bacterium]